MRKVTSLSRRAGQWLALFVVGLLVGCDDPNETPCKVDGDCTQGARCNVALDVSVCQALHSGAEWTPCSSDDLCASERCLVRSSRVCVEPGWQRSGEACERDDDCMDDLSCNDGGTCDPKRSTRQHEGS